MGEAKGRIIADTAGAVEVLRRARRLAVLGIKPATRRHAAAYYVPAYLRDAGYEIVPVPTYYPELREILGEPVYRRLADVPGAVDLVVVFRRSHDIPLHVPDIIEKQPGAVWFQAGIRNDAAAAELADAGIDVVQDRCTMIDHRLIR
jgi:uncharacterized protein